MGKVSASWISPRRLADGFLQFSSTCPNASLLSRCHGSDNTLGEHLGCGSVGGSCRVDSLHGKHDMDGLRAFRSLPTDINASISQFGPTLEITVLSSNLRSDSVLSGTSVCRHYHQPLIFHWDGRRPRFCPPRFCARLAKRCSRIAPSQTRPCSTALILGRRSCVMLLLLFCPSSIAHHGPRPRD